MYKNIFRKINFLIYLVLAILIAATQSTFFGYFPLHYIQPDILLILVVYFGFKRSLLEGGAFVVLGSFIMETNSGAGNYFLLTTYMYTFVISTILSRTIVIPDFFSSIGIVAGLTVLKKVGILILLGMSGKAENGLKHFLIYLVPSIVAHAILTPICFAIFHKIDLKTFKDDHAEDEYDINKGF